MIRRDSSRPASRQQPRKFDGNRADFAVWRLTALAYPLLKHNLGILEGPGGLFQRGSSFNAAVRSFPCFTETGIHARH